MRTLGPDFDAFVAERSTMLLRTAFALCGDRGHAEDMLQAALLRTARRWGAVRGDPVAYTRRVLANLAKDRWRDRSRRITEAELTESAAAVGDSGTHERFLVRHALLTAAQQLPPRQRAVLALRFFDELSVEQTAEVLGCSPGTVKSQTHHALAKLREQLAGVLIEEESHAE